MSPAYLSHTTLYDVTFQGFETPNFFLNSWDRLRLIGITGLAAARHFHRIGFSFRTMVVVQHLKREKKRTRVYTVKHNPSVKLQVGNKTIEKMLEMLEVAGMDRHETSGPLESEKHGQKFVNAETEKETRKKQPHAIALPDKAYGTL